eukprot:COSAG02_NODE_4496_length_5292_cov_16.155979_4_plen_77_part_00
MGNEKLPPSVALLVQSITESKDFITEMRWCVFSVRRSCIEWQYQPECGSQLSEFTLLLQVRQLAFTRKLYVKFKLP